MSLFERRQILITCGTGGVGKTTLSAALAIRAAVSGKRTIVVTIDPARRLATSLGLEALDDQPTDLTPRLRKAAEAAGAPVPQGTLEALMPDTRRTLEVFFRSLAPTPAIADKLVANPIFEIFARDFSGTNEYMALERLDSLAHAGRYDCIVLDTPPSRNTIAFLKAPQLLARLFDEGLIRWLVLPANKILATGVKKAMGILENLTGAGFIRHLVDFAGSLIQLQDTFTTKVKRISALLSSRQVGFVMVTGPTPETLPEFSHFIDAIRASHLQFDGLVVNRTLGAIQSEEPAGAPDLAAALKTLEALQTRERRVTEQLESRVRELSRDSGAKNQEGAPFFIRVPELVRDVHSMEDLFHVSTALGDALDLAGRT